MLGNGWTVDVIAHIMGHFNELKKQPVEVLSMYDGMSCGHIALDKLGVNVQAYYATEIDPYHQPPKNLLRCEIEKASPMAGLWGSTPPFLSGYMKTLLVVPLSIR